MAESTLKLLMVASEAAPFAKTGGLADVVGSLPKALLDAGHDVRVVMPWYRTVREVTGRLQTSRSKINVPMGGRTYQVTWRKGDTRGVPVYFIEAPELYERAGLYGENGVDYPDNAERFGLLSRASLELARNLDFIPNVIHAHDWQTGLVPVYLHKNLWRDPFFAKTGSLFTIHNLGYQGVFPMAESHKLNLDPSLLTSDGIEYHGKISLLKAGITFADRVNTVSPTYCQEIQSSQHGMGLDGILRARSDRLYGLLNGLDNALWSPGQDEKLVSNYTAADLTGKRLCKAALQQELGLKVNPEVPIAAMITRLDSQKGIELVLESWDKIMQYDLQLVILGTGNPDFENRLAEAASYYPGKAAVLLQFDDALSRRIYSGSDLFLMPSRYEPCGLGQLIALRYGAVPVVHATGGLADTIFDPQDSTDGNGFVFHHYQHASFLQALGRALEVYREPRRWQKIQLQGMIQDLSWQAAAKEYIDLYRLCMRTQQ